MPATTAEVLQEFELESVTTRRVLERVPTNQLTWKPPPKSRSLGQLALHVAIGPGLISQWALKDSMEMPELSVYLRLLNVPVPAIYGPSADENPMLAAQG